LDFSKQNLLDVPANRHRRHGRPWRRPSRKTQGISSYDWMAGSSPAMTVERKFSNVFMASSAGGNIRVIKFRDDGGGDPLARPSKPAYSC